MCQKCYILGYYLLLPYIILHKKRYEIFSNVFKDLFIVFPLIIPILYVVTIHYKFGYCCLPQSILHFNSLALTASQSSDPF